MAAGLFFVWTGAHELVKGLDRHSVPKEMAITGKVKNVLDDEVVVQDEDGRLVRVFIEKNTRMNKNLKESEGKIIRVVGTNKECDKASEFRAEIIWCCDED